VSGVANGGRVPAAVRRSRRRGRCRGAAAAAHGPRVTPPANRFDLGQSAGEWPQATVQAKPGGANFCDHCGGSGRALLGEVVARLASAFGPVTVEEL
jgi:hypothetical protein